jgi:hypothetical protein
MTADPAFSFAGMPVYANPHCERIVPVRQHKGGGPAYHARIQKKWTKRWGTKIERVTFIVGGFGMRGDAMFMHPECLAKIRMAAND